MTQDYVARKFAEDAHQGMQTYFGTSITRQQSRFGKIASPLRLQTSEFLEQKNLHLLGESICLIKNL